MKKKIKLKSRKLNFLESIGKQTEQNTHIPNIEHTFMYYVWRKVLTYIYLRNLLLVLYVYLFTRT